MKLPIALISGLILPLCAGNIGCQSTGFGEQGTLEMKGTVKQAPNGDTSYEASVGITLPWGGSKNSGSTPAPGQNKAKATEGGEAKKDGQPQASTSNPVTAEGIVSSDSTVMTGTTTLEDGSTWSGTAALVDDAYGENVLYEWHYGA